MAWQSVHDEFTIDDIGARLLANLARGIYNHEAVLREYAQNARDAYLDLSSIPEHSSISVRIVDESTISIQDSGIGMDEGDVRASKRIAVSPKAGLDNRAGFRGIGIWAGFQACDHLEIETTKLGVPHRFRLQIDFSDILEHVDEDVNIKELLDHRFRIQKEPAPRDEHWTQVKLVGLQGDYRRLTDAQELERIVSQVLPCKIDPTFEHAEKVNEILHSIDGYQDFTVLVEGGEVFRKFPAGLQAPKSVTLEKDGEEYGRAWYCTGSRSLSPRGCEYRSFRLRIQNFAVGRAGIFDDEDGSGFAIINKVRLGSATHLNWHVGEIHVTHPNIKPDTPRSSLELDSLARRSIECIRGFYEDRIADSRAGATFNTFQKQLDNCRRALESTHPIDDTQLSAMLSELQEQDSLTKGRVPSDKVKRRVRELLNKSDVKAQRRTLIKKLEEQGAETEELSEPAQAQPSETANQSQETSSQPEPNHGNESAAVVQDFGQVDVEQLISDIFASVQGAIGDDPELVAEVCQAIQGVLQSHGLSNYA